ncbi:MAG: nickel-type superoxide dismutase maturation protease [Acidimicrobiia bacterium]|nr:nickel-type superoxide dismutase maturation protease [Acidimicrobiia bacterium]
MTITRRWWVTGLLVAGGWAGSRITRMEVVGDSMRPTLEPGDRLVLSRSRRIRPGDLVAVVDPRQARRIVVKRVAEVSPAGLTVLGDNPSASTDSRVFGPVSPAAVRGRVVYRYHPPPRRGRLSNGGVDRPL